MNKYIAIFVVVLVFGGIIFMATNKNDTPPLENTEVNNINNEVSQPEPMTTTTNDNQEKNMTATIQTNQGNIVIEFDDEQAPKTVANFTKLAGEGLYNGIKFHRVIKGFMIQAGDPLTKDESKMALWGTGDPGYKFNDEIDAKGDLYTKGGYLKGTVAMANSGPNTNGSQFFIMTEDYPLPPLYTIFGRVTSGQDVVDAIANVKTGAGDRPVEAVIINKITFPPKADQPQAEN